MLVAKPWIDELPAPETSHVLLGVPGKRFSQATGLAQSAAPARRTPPVHVARAASDRMASSVRRRLREPADRHRGLVSMTHERVTGSFSCAACPVGMRLRPCGVRGPPPRAVALRVSATNA